MPKFKHDCNRCEFIGTLADRQDLYICDGPMGISLILRYSDNGWEYSSYNMDKREFLTTLKDLMRRYLIVTEGDYQKARKRAIANIIICTGATAISNEIEFAV